VDAVRDALYASKIVSYAQGMELLRSGSTTYDWNLNLSDIATIWRGGCIIRAKFLNRIVEAYQRDPALHNLLLDRYFTRAIRKAQPKWRLVLSTAIKHGVAAPAFSASWLTSTVTDRLVFRRICCKPSAISSGAHIERIDKPGVFHTEWLEPEKKPAEKAAEPKTYEPHHAGE
jgi:6-phosphogluconate dehydrogenase